MPGDVFDRQSDLSFRGLYQPPPPPPPPPPPENPPPPLPEVDPGGVTDEVIAVFSALDIVVVVDAMLPLSQRPPYQAG